MTWSNTSRHIALPSTAVVQTADIGHFFMSGTPREILKDIPYFLESEIDPSEPANISKHKTDFKKLITDVLETLLDNQFVLNEHVLKKSCTFVEDDQRHRDGPQT